MFLTICVDSARRSIVNPDTLVESKQTKKANICLHINIYTFYMHTLTKGKNYLKCIDDDAGIYGIYDIG